MAGHSKWANIRHRKGRQDTKRGKLFSRLIKEVTVAARIGGDDLSGNPRLRSAVDNAFGNNMPRDTIERAINRGSGGAEGEDFHEVRYEGYGPGGTAVMVDCMTDNRNRTVAEVRHVFSKCGGSLGTDGSVSYMFTKVGLLSYSNDVDQDVLLEAALDSGATDVVVNDDQSIDVLTEPDSFSDVKDGMVASEYVPIAAEITMRADNNNDLDNDAADKMVRLLDMLEDLDDVQQVYSNADISDEILTALGDRVDIG